MSASQKFTTWGCLLFCHSVWSVSVQGDDGRPQDDGIDHSVPQELAVFQPVPENPLFTGTGRDTWDARIRERGYILREADGYHMWYTGYRGERSDTKLLGYATSGDGIHWVRHPENPVCDQSWVEDMCVVKHEGTYYMFAEGRNDIAHMLVSQDRVHWQECGPLDIRTTTGEPIPPGPYGTPTVYVEKDTWYLFFERRDQGVWLATSKDRKIWTKIQEAPVLRCGPDAYDRHAVALNQVIQHKGKYYGVYHASGQQPWRDWSTNLAVSDDLVHWRKYAGNPILKGNLSSGVFVHDGQRYRLYTMHDAVRLFLPTDRRERLR